MPGSEHGSTLTSSVVAGVREVISATVATSVRLESLTHFSVAAVRPRGDLWKADSRIAELTCGGHN